MFTKATKKQSKLRLAIYGPSGSGKTYTSLAIGSALSDKIALIDTERGSASKYVKSALRPNGFEFDVVDLQEFAASKKEDFGVKHYIAAINNAAQAGYSVLIIDSMTHAWQALLDQVDKIAKAKFKGNTWSAWSEGTPIQRDFVDAILNYPGHIIACMRVKTEWIQEKDVKTGKNKPVKIGLNPEQGKGIEYEFDVLMQLNEDHYATIEKDRTGLFQDQIIKMPGDDFGKKLLEWLNDGDVLIPPSNTPLGSPSLQPAINYKEELFKIMIENGLEKKSIKAFAQYAIENKLNLTDEADVVYEHHQDELIDLIRAFKTIQGNQNESV